MGIYPLQYLTRGDGLCNHPRMLWIVNNRPILTYFYKNLAQINKFCSRNGWFLRILAKFYQKFLLKCKIWVSQAQRIVLFLLIACSKFPPKSIHQIARFQFQKDKFSSFWGALRHPLPAIWAQAPNLRIYVSPSWKKKVKDGSTLLSNRLL